MISRMIFSAMAAIFMLTTAGSALAMEQGNKRKGKYTYRKVYKACHARGAVDTAKPPVNPDARTQAEWEQLFDNRDFGAFGCDEEWAQLSDTDVTDIFTYLHAHASDSPTPAKCK
ncbi:MAG: cytochrome c family protein [Desulfobacterales bacterium]